MCPGTIDLVETRIGQPVVIARDRRGRHLRSSIGRQPVSENTLYLTWTALAGDQSTDTRSKKDGGQIHGGNDKAVYVYPEKHYPAWLAELSEEGMGGRSFGENLRVRGITEADVCIGDCWEWGEALVEVSGVRTPCLTLNAYYGGQNMVKLMTTNGRCGWYLRVLRPGRVPTSGPIQVVHHSGGPTIEQVFAAKMGRPANV